MKAIVKFCAGLSLAMAQPAAAARAPRPPRTPSAVEREHVNATINFEPIGLLSGNYLGFVTGISAGLFLNPNLVLRGTIRTSKSCLGIRCSYGYDAIGVSAQSFISNSGFVEGGLLHEQNIMHLIDNNDYDGHTSREYGFSYRTVNSSIMLAIGQQWQWHSFTLGARWAALSFPVINQVAELKTLDPQYSVSAEETHTLDRLKAAHHWVLANLILGWSF